MSPTRWALGLLLLAGCYHPSADSVDRVVCQLASGIRDAEPVAKQKAEGGRQEAEGSRQNGDSGKPLETPNPSVGQAPIHPVVSWQNAPTPLVAPSKPSTISAATTLLCQVKPPPRPLLLPPNFPGADAPPIKWPTNKEAMKQAARELYPALPPLPETPKAAPGPGGQPLTLSDLQRLALGNHPSVRNAAAGVEAARGAVRQAGAYPNPSVFWEADTVGTSGAGYQGAGFDQPIKSANKLKLQKAAATMDLKNAELALRRAQTDVMYGVRTNYFALLVALENIKVSRALAELTDRVYRYQVDIVEEPAALPTAPYEPMQLRPLALGARFTLLQAIKQYEASWRQLAAAIGIPGLPLTEVAGRVDMPIPVYRFEEVLAQALARHTDMLTAQNTLQKARYQLELAQVTPFPDFDIHSLIQKDYTTPPRSHLVYSIAMTLPVPVWDQNKGGIQQAFNQMLQASEGPHQIQVNLTTSLADAINRYEANREQVRITWQQIQDQVRAYRGIFERRQTLPDQVAFNDIVTAEQTLVTYIAAYVTALGAQWLAVADVANVLQTDDLFQTNQVEEMPLVPDLGRLLPLPCCHPCGTLTRPAAQAPDVQGLPAPTAEPMPPATSPAPLPGPGPVIPEPEISQPVSLLPVRPDDGKLTGAPIRPSGR